MPRYHFNVFDGRAYLDTEGTELPDAYAAQLMAVESAGQFIKDQAKRIELGEDWRMEVTDERGLILFRLDFHIAASSALQRAQPA